MTWNKDIFRGGYPVDSGGVGWGGGVAQCVCK